MKTKARTGNLCPVWAFLRLSQIYFQVSQLVQLVTPSIEDGKDLDTVRVGIGPEVDQKISAQKFPDVLRVPGFFFDKGSPLRQKAQRSHGLFQCGQECICGFGFQKLVCDMVDDGAKLLFGLRGERDSIFLHGSDLRAEPGKGFVQRGRFSAPGLVQAGLHHGVKFVTAQSITGGESGG